MKHRNFSFLFCVFFLWFSCSLTIVVTVSYYFYGLVCLIDAIYLLLGCVVTHS